MADPITPRHYDPEVAEMMKATTMTGLPEFLQIRTVDAGPAFLVAELDARSELQNPFGSLHGGVISALVDHVLGAVLYPVIERGAWAATTEFKLNLLAPVHEGVVQARAVIISMTKRTAVVTVEVSNAGRLCGLAQGTVLIASPRPTS